MNYNKRQFTKVNDKKVLHKVRKQWVTISVAMLGMLGLGVGTAYTSASASSNDDDESLEEHITNNFAKARKQAISQPMQHTANGRHMNAYDPKNIENQANLMTQHLMRLAGSNGQNNLSESGSSTPQKDSSQSNKPKAGTPKSNTNGNSTGNHNGQPTTGGTDKSSTQSTGEQTNSKDGNNGTKMPSGNKPQTNGGGSTPATSGTKHSTDNAGGNSNNQDHTGQNGSGKNVPASKPNQNSGNSHSITPITPSHKKTPTPPRASYISAQMWLGSDKSRKPFTLTGPINTPITAPNGKQYILKHASNNDIHIYFKKNNEYIDVTPYFQKTPVPINHENSKGLSDGDISPAIPTVSQYNITPHIKLNSSAVKSSDYGYLKDDNGSSSFSASPIKLWGYPGEYVKIPYSDITIKGGVINNLSNYQCLSDTTSILSDNTLKTVDNNLKVTNSDNSQYTPYIKFNNSDKYEFNNIDENEKITFNGDDNYNNRQYLTYQLTSNKDSNGNLIATPVNSDSTVTLQYYPTTLKLIYQEMVSDGNGGLKSDTNPDHRFVYTDDKGQPIPVEGKEGTPIQFGSDFTKLQNSGKAKSDRLIDDPNSVANQFPSDINHTNGKQSSVDKNYINHIIHIVNIKGAVYSKLPFVIAPASDETSDAITKDLQNSKNLQTTKVAGTSATWAFGFKPSNNKPINNKSIKLDPQHNQSQGLDMNSAASHWFDANRGNIPNETDTLNNDTLDQFEDLNGKPLTGADSLYFKVINGNGKLAWDPTSLNSKNSYNLDGKRVPIVRYHRQRTLPVNLPYVIAADSDTTAQIQAAIKNNKTSDVEEYSLENLHGVTNQSDDLTDSSYGSNNPASYNDFTSNVNNFVNNKNNSKETDTLEQDTVFPNTSRYKVDNNDIPSWEENNFNVTDLSGNADWISDGKGNMVPVVRYQRTMHDHGPLNFIIAPSDDGTNDSAIKSAINGTDANDDPVAELSSDFKANRNTTGDNSQNTSAADSTIQSKASDWIKSVNNKSRTLSNGSTVKSTYTLRSDTESPINYHATNSDQIVWNSDETPLNGSTTGNPNYLSDRSNRKVPVVRYGISRSVSGKIPVLIAPDSDGTLFSDKASDGSLQNLINKDTGHKYTWLSDVSVQNEQPGGRGIVNVDDLNNKLNNFVNNHKNQQDMAEDYNPNSDISYNVNDNNYAITWNPFQSGSQDAHAKYNERYSNLVNLNVNGRTQPVLVLRYHHHIKATAPLRFIVAPAYLSDASIHSKLVAGAKASPSNEVYEYTNANFTGYRGTDGSKQKPRQSDLSDKANKCGQYTNDLEQWQASHTNLQSGNQLETDRIMSDTANAPTFNVGYNNAVNNGVSWNPDSNKEYTLNQEVNYISDGHGMVPVVRYVPYYSKPLPFIVAPAYMHDNQIISHMSKGAGPAKSSDFVGAKYGKNAYEYTNATFGDPSVHVKTNTNSNAPVTSPATNCSTYNNDINYFNQLPSQTFYIQNGKKSSNGQPFPSGNQFQVVVTYSVMSDTQKNPQYQSKEFNGVNWSHNLAQDPDGVAKSEYNWVKDGAGNWIPVVRYIKKYSVHVYNNNPKPANTKPSDSSIPYQPVTNQSGTSTYVSDYETSDDEKYNSDNSTLPTNNPNPSTPATPTEYHRAHHDRAPLSFIIASDGANDTQIKADIANNYGNGNAAQLYSHFFGIRISDAINGTQEKHSDFPANSDSYNADSNSNPVLPDTFEVDKDYRTILSDWLSKNKPSTTQTLYDNKNKNIGSLTTYYTLESDTEKAPMYRVGNGNNGVALDEFKWQSDASHPDDHTTLSNQYPSGTNTWTPVIRYKKHYKFDVNLPVEIASDRDTNKSNYVSGYIKAHYDVSDNRVNKGSEVNQLIKGTVPVSDYSDNKNTNSTKSALNTVYDSNNNQRDIHNGSDSAHYSSFDNRDNIPNGHGAIKPFKIQMNLNQKGDPTSVTWMPSPFNRSNNTQYQYDWDSDGHDGQEPVFRYTSYYINTYPVILQDQNGHRTYAYLTGQSKKEAGFTPYPLVPTTPNSISDLKAGSFQYISGASGYKLPSDMRIVTPSQSYKDIYNADNSVYKTLSANLEAAKAITNSDINNKSLIGTWQPSTGTWVKPSDSIVKTAKTNASAWYNKYATSTKSTKIPVLYYYTWHTTPVQLPSVMMGSDYQTSNYKPVNINGSFKIRYIPIDKTNTNSTNAINQSVWTPRLGRYTNPNNDQNIYVFNNINLINEVNNDDFKGYTPDTSSDDPKYINNVNNATLTVTINHPKFKNGKIVSGITPVWSADGVPSVNGLGTPNWYKDDKNTSHPIIRYIPKVTQYFRIWVGSDTQSSDYDPKRAISIPFTGNARSITQQKLSDIWNDQIKPYLQSTYKNTGLTSNQNNPSDINSDATFDKNNPLEDDLIIKFNDQPEYARNHDQNFVNGQPNVIMNDLGAQNTPSNFINHDTKVNGVKGKQYDNYSDVTSDVNSYHTPYWADKSNHNSSQIDRNNYAEPVNGPVLRFKNMVTVTLPVALEPEPVAYNSKTSTQDNPQYITDPLPAKFTKSPVMIADLRFKLPEQVENKTLSEKVNVSDILDNISDFQVVMNNPLSHIPKGLIPANVMAGLKSNVNAAINFVERVYGQVVDINTVQRALRAYADNTYNSDNHVSTKNTINSKSNLPNVDKGYWSPTKDQLGSNYQIWLNDQSDNNRHKFPLAEWKTSTSKEPLDHPLPIIYYMPQYDPQISEIEHYWTPKYDADQGQLAYDINNSQNYKKLLSDLSHKVNNLNGATNYNHGKSDASDFVNYLATNRNLNQGGKVTPSDYSWNNQPSDERGHVPYLYVRNQDGQGVNAYLRSIGHPLSPDTVIGDLVPLYDNVMDSSDYSIARIGVDGQPRIIENLSDTQPGHPSDSFTLDPDHRNGFPFPSNTSSDSKYLNADLYGDTGIDYYHFLMDMGGHNGLPNNVAQINVGSSNEILKNISDRKLFYPTFKDAKGNYVPSVNPLYLTVKKGNATYQYLCPFISGQYYTPKIESNGAVADYSTLAPIKYNDKSVQINKDPKSGRYVIAHNNLTPMKSYTIKFLNAAVEINPKGLPDPTPIAESRVIAPIGSEFHYYPKNQVVFETNALGQTFPVACLDPDMKNNKDGKSNASLFNQLHINPSDFGTDSKWQTDAMDETYNHYGYGHDKPSYVYQNNEPVNLPENVPDAMYNWRTSNQITFNPNDPKDDVDSNGKQTGYYADPEKASDMKDTNTSDKPDFTQQLQWNSHFTNGPSYLNENANGQPLNPNQTNEIPLYVHPGENQEVRINVDYINVMDDDVLGHFHTHVMNPSDVKKFNILSYTPTYDAKNGDYEIGSNDLNSMHLTDNGPVGHYAGPFQYVMSGINPHYFNGASNLTAYIFLSPYSPSDMVNHNLGLNVVYVNADTGKPFYNYNSTVSSNQNVNGNNPVSDYVWDKYNNSDNSDEVEKEAHQLGRNIDYNPYILVNDNELITTKDGVNYLIDSDDNCHQLNNVPMYEIGKDGLKHPVKFTKKLVDGKPQSDGNFKPYQVIPNGETSPEWARTLPTLNDALSDGKDSASDAVISRLKNFNSNGWIPVNVSYYKYHLDSSDNVPGKPTTANKYYENVEKTPVFTDAAFPSGMTANGPDLSSKEGRIVYDRYGSAFLRGKVVIALRKPQSHVQQESHLIQFIDVDNFSDETTNGRSDNVGAHLLPSAWDITIPYNASSDEINKTVNNYMNKYFKKAGLQFNGKVEVTKNNDSSDKDGADVDQLSDGTKLTLPHFRGASYRIFLKHNSYTENYGPITFNQNIFARFVYQGADGQYHDIPQSDLPSAYRHIPAAQIQHESWFTNPSANLYPTPWFHNPNTFGYHNPKYSSDMYTGNIGSDASIKGYTPANGKYLLNDSSDGKVVHLLKTQYIDWNQKTGDYDLDPNAPTIIKGYTSLDPNISSIQFYSGTESDGSDVSDPLVNVMIPYISRDASGNFDANKYNAQENATVNNAEMYMIPAIVPSKYKDPKTGKYEPVINPFFNDYKKLNGVSWSDKAELSSIHNRVTQILKDEYNDPAKTMSEYDPITGLPKQHGMTPAKGLTKNMYQVITYRIQNQVRPLIVHYYDAITHKPISDGIYDFEYKPNPLANQSDHKVNFPSMLSDYFANNGKDNNQETIPTEDSDGVKIKPLSYQTLDSDTNKTFIPNGYVWTGASSSDLNNDHSDVTGITSITKNGRNDGHTLSISDYEQNGLASLYSQLENGTKNSVSGKFIAYTDGKNPDVVNIYLVKPHMINPNETADETVTIKVNGNSDRSQWPSGLPSNMPNNKSAKVTQSDKKSLPSDKVPKTVIINGKYYKAVVTPSDQPTNGNDSSDRIDSDNNSDVTPQFVPSSTNGSDNKPGAYVPWHNHTSTNGIPHYHYHYVINYVPIKKADEYIKFEINGKKVTPDADLPGVPSYIKNGIHQSSSDQFHNSDWTPFTPPVIVINQAGQYRYDSKYGRKYYPHIVPIVSKHAGPISGATIPGFMPGSDGNMDEYNPSYRLDKNVNQYDEYVVNYVVNYTPYKVANENVKFEINGNPAAQVSGVPSYMKTGIQQHANDQSDKDDWVPFEPQVVTINGVKYEPHIIPANNYNGPSSDGTISSFTSDASDGKANEYNGRYYAGVNKNGAGQYDVNYVVNYTPEKEANEYIRYEINGKDISSNVKVPSYMKEPATTPRQTTNNQSDASDWTPVTPPSLIINGQKYVPNIEPDANYPAAKETIPSFTPNGSDSSSQFDNHYRTGISNGVIQFKVHYVVNYTPVREAKETVTYEVNGHPIDTVPGFPSYMYNGVQQTSNTVTNRSDWLPITPPIVTVQSSKHDQKYGMKYYPHIVPIVSKNAGPIAGQAIPGFVPGADLNSRTDVDEYNEEQYGSAYEYNPQYFTGLSKNGVAKYFVHYVVDYTPYKAANENISFEVNGKPASQESDVPAYMKAGVQQNANDQSDKDDWVPFEPQVITINGIKYDPHIVPVKSQHTGPSSNGTISSFTSDASDGKADEYNGRYYAGVNKNGASQYNVNYVVNYTPEKAAGEHVQIVVNGKPSSLVPSDINRSDTISDGHNWPAIQLPHLHGYTPEVIAQPNVESLDINNGVIPGYVPNNGDTGMYSPTIYNGVQNSKQYYYVDYVIDYVPEAAGEFVQYEVNGQPSNKVPSDITRSSTVASDQNWPAITIPQLPGYRADVLMQPAINQIKNGTIPAYQTSSDVQTGEYSSKLADGTQHGAPYYYAPYIINYVPEKAHETVHYEVNGKPSKLVPSDISRQSGGSDTSNWNSIPLPHVPGYHPEIVQQPASDGVNNNEIPGYDTSSNQNGEFNSRHYDKSDNSYDVHYIINYVPTERATEHVHFEVNGKAVKPGSIKGLPNDVYHYDFPSDGKPNWGPVQVPSSIVINGQTYVPEIVAQPSDAMITKGRVPGYTANDVDHSGEYSMTHVVPGTNGTDFNVNYVINYVPQPASGPAAHTGETIRYEINGKLVPSGSIPGLPSDVNRSDTSSDQNQGWNPADVPSQITINGKTYIPVVIAEPGDMPVTNGQVPGYTFSDEFMGSHYVGNNYFHVTYIINYVPKNEPATAKVVIVYPNHHKKTYVIHGDQGTPINYKQFIPKHERYHFGKHDMVIINNHTNVIYIIPKHRSKLVIRVPKRGRITRRIVTIHHVPYLIVRRGKLIIRKIRLTSPRVHKAATPRHKLPQTGESTVHTSVWATVFAGLATVMASLGHAIGFKKHRE